MKKLFFIISILIIQSLTIGSAPEDELKKSIENEMMLYYTNQTLEALLPKKIYDFPIDSFIVIKEKFKKDENLNDLFFNYNISSATIEEIEQKSKYMLDPKDIRAGHYYTILASKKNPKEIKHFIYDLNNFDYMLFSFDSYIVVEKKTKNIIKRKRMSSGKVKSSLWQTMKANSLDPALSVEIAEIFGWAFDVYDLKKEDEFKILYEKHYVDGEYIGYGKIQAAYFVHDGVKHYAFYYKNGKLQGYFDEKGESLDREYLKFPLRFSRISSGFTKSRFHPVLKRWRPHLGIDFAAKKGTPVYAVADGVIEKAYYSKSAGNMIKIKHDDEKSTGYLHLNNFTKGIEEGAKVKKGQVIGYVGNTGISTGPHLDFRFWKDDNLVNPLKVEAPRIAPIPAELKADFDNFTLSFIKALEN